MSKNPKLALLQFSSQLEVTQDLELGPTRGLPRLLAQILQAPGDVLCEVRDLQRNADAGDGAEAVYLEQALTPEEALQLAVASTNQATWCLYGMLSRQGDELALACNLLDIETGTPLREEVARGAPDDLTRLVVETCVILHQAMTPDAEPLDPAPWFEGLSGSLDGMLAYLSALASTDIDERISLLSESVGADETFVDAGLELAQCYLIARQFKEAEELIVAMTDRERMSHDKLCQTAMRFFTRGMVQEGMYLGRKAMIWQPDNPESYVPYIRISLLTGNVGDGIKYTKRAEELDPTNPSLQAYLSLFYRFLQRTDEAIIHAQKAIEMGPDEAFHYYALGSAHLFSGNIRTAIRHFERALELNPSDVATHREMSLAHCETLPPEEAREKIDRSLTMLPSDAFLLTLKARTWMEEDPDQAQLCLERAIQAQPGFPDSHGLLGQLLREQGDHQRATQHIEKALSLDPQNPEWHREQGKLYLAMDMTDEAQAAFQRAVELED